jgi:uncharacterized phage protein gp47/JayE
MPWSTPTLRVVRSAVRDYIQSTLPGSDANVPNSVLRVISDSQGGLCHLTLQYIDWLALQLLPDTAEHEWLDRHGKIWLVNADGTTGRKMATLATGEVLFTGQNGMPVPKGTQLEASSGDIGFETIEDIVVGTVPTPAKVRALDPGTVGNLPPGSAMAMSEPPPGIDNLVEVVELSGGTDTETDEELRARVLRRIQQPPMGGAAYDYEAWALAVPGVTRAWAQSEMGIGTVTLRFMMDDLRADNDGFPLPDDIAKVASYINTKRPVTVKDAFVEAPLKQPINFDIVNLVPDTPAVRAAIEQCIREMLFERAAPGQTIYAAWKYAAIMNAPVISFDMGNCDDDVMPSQGHLGYLNDIFYSTVELPAPADTKAITSAVHV